MKREIEETRNIYQNVFYLFFVFKKHGTQIVINLSLFLVFKVKQQKNKKWKHYQKKPKLLIYK